MSCYGLGFGVWPVFAVSASVHAAGPVPVLVSVSAWTCVYARHLSVFVPTGVCLLVLFFVCLLV